MNVDLRILAILVCGLLYSCQSEKTNKVMEAPSQLFNNVPVASSKVNFKNNIKESNNFNFIVYIYIYNGGGVAAGDINNDGLVDIYFTANQESNKLYLNKGDMVFEDITKNADVGDATGWSTGVSMIDINNDGYLDIYVCKSGSVNNHELRKNKLYVNQKNNTFIDMASQYGLDDPAFSTQAYFFDYDKDGDQDMYLVNHRVDFDYTYKIGVAQQQKTSNLTTDKLYRNDGQTFTNVTEEAGILNNTWGLSAAVGDYNNDGWPDIYVCNDFIYGDHLWINNKQGGFTDEVTTILDHTSFFSMGSDIADIDNDGQEDLIVVDMVSEDHVASKRNMAAMSTEQFHLLTKLGNHYQYMTNTLHLNRGKSSYSDISYLAGVANSDWSWGTFIR